MLFQSWVCFASKYMFLKVHISWIEPFSPFPSPPFYYFLYDLLEVLFKNPICTLSILISTLWPKWSLQIQVCLYYLSALRMLNDFLLLLISRVKACTLLCEWVDNMPHCPTQFQALAVIPVVQLAYSHPFSFRGVHSLDNNLYAYPDCKALY